MSTIAAISTPYGKGGVAVIRISGEEALSVLGRVFFPRSKREITSYPPSNAVYGDVYREGKIIDNALAIYFKAPKSYTGEDTAELYIHGGVTLSRLVLEAVFSAGAVPARAGEFTERAFLSSKISLTEAEGIADLIDSRSASMAEIAASSASGRLSQKIGGIYDRLVALLGSVYAFIDYPDEDLTDVSPEEMKAELLKIKTELEKLKNTYHTGKAVCEGISTVIIGKPNVGKSSLLNLLLGEERAIVSPVPGTTRDTVEETAVFGRIQLRLIDTAGVRESEDEIERIGVERALAKAEKADLIFAVFDGSRELEHDDEKIIDELSRLKDKTVVALINKSDLERRLDTEKIKTLTDRVEYVSAFDEKDRDALVALVERLYVDDSLSFSDDGIITNARQYASVVSALDSVNEALLSLERGFTQDIAGSLLEMATSSLGLCDGRKVNDDVVHDIFSRFCVGK